MREILFKGKNNNGEWVYGWLGHLHSYDSNTKEISSVYFTEISNDLGSRLNTIVDYKTVGQYTGLTDKNGKKIFEGDIVKYKNTDGIKFNGVALTVIGKIVYNEKNASFAISGKDEIGAKHYDYFPIKNIEIIGNIHDNPELIGGDGQ